jgi:hypothetical protein
MTTNTCRLFRDEHKCGVYKAECGTVCRHLKKKTFHWAFGLAPLNLPVLVVMAIFDECNPISEIIDQTYHWDVAHNIQQSLAIKQNSQ